MPSSILTICFVMWSTTKTRYFFCFPLVFRVYPNVFLSYYSRRLNSKFPIYKFLMYPVLLEFTTLKWALNLIAWHASQLNQGNFFLSKTRTVVLKCFYPVRFYIGSSFADVISEFLNHSAVRRSVCCLFSEFQIWKPPGGSWENFVPLPDNLFMNHCNKFSLVIQPSLFQKRFTCGLNFASCLMH